VAIFCLDEIIVLKDHGYKTKSVNFDSLGYVCRNLQYLETPQYLRKYLFPIHPDLKYTGLMNPIESRHHLKADEFFRFREGVVCNRPVKANQGSWADIGLKKVKLLFSDVPIGL
jgi:predicted SPOUT superfamily RNA methylase MTH1